MDDSDSEEEERDQITRLANFIAELATSIARLEDRCSAIEIENARLQHVKKNVLTTIARFNSEKKPFSNTPWENEVHQYDITIRAYQLRIQKINDELKKNEREFHSNKIGIDKLKNKKEKMRQRLAYEKIKQEQKQSEEKRSENLARNRPSASPSSSQSSTVASRSQPESAQLSTVAPQSSPQGKESAEAPKSIVSPEPQRIARQVVREETGKLKNEARKSFLSRRNKPKLFMHGDPLSTKLEADDNDMPELEAGEEE